MANRKRRPAAARARPAFQAAYWKGPLPDNLRDMIVKALGPPPWSEAVIQREAKWWSKTARVSMLVARGVVRQAIQEEAAQASRLPHENAGELCTNEPNPYPNEHSCRIYSPSSFIRFRRDNRKDPPVIYGFRPYGKGSAVQAYRYPVEEWTEAEARKHCKRQGGSFTPAAASNPFFRDYGEAHAYAQERADKLGIPQGLRATKEYGKPGFAVAALPREELRSGAELGVEEVKPGGPIPNQSYEPIVLPRDWTQFPRAFDIEGPVMGFRGPLMKTLVEGAPKTKAALGGYMTALYLFRMMEQPPAYYRPLSIVQLQAQVTGAIRELEERRPPRRS